MELTEEQWFLIGPLFPPPNPAQRGRPRKPAPRLSYSSQRRGGAPARNLNALKHGRYARQSRNGVPSSQAPQDLADGDTTRQRLDHQIDEQSKSPQICRV